MNKVKNDAVYENWLSQEKWLIRGIAIIFGLIILGATGYITAIALRYMDNVLLALAAALPPLLALGIGALLLRRLGREHRIMERIEQMIERGEDSLKQLAWIEFGIGGIMILMAFSGSAGWLLVGLVVAFDGACNFWRAQKVRKFRA